MKIFNGEYTFDSTSFTAVGHQGNRVVYQKNKSGPTEILFVASSDKAARYIFERVRDSIERRESQSTLSVPQLQRKWEYLNQDPFTMVDVVNPCLGRILDQNGNNN